MAKMRVAREGELGNVPHRIRTFPGVPSQALVTRGKARRVVVLGAGMAGLSAAYELIRAGHDVTILEARDRPGGRVHTLRDGFADGAYAEAGAMFIPGLHNLTIGYAKRFGLKLTAFPVAQQFYYVRNTRIPDPTAPNAAWPYALWPEEQQGGIFGMMQSYLSPTLNNGFGDPRDPLWPPATVAPIDAMTVVDFLRSKGASPGAIDIIRRGYFDCEGDGASQVSALFTLRDLSLTRDGMPPQLVYQPPKASSAIDRDATGEVREGTLKKPAAYYQIDDGNAHLPFAFAKQKELKGRIHYKTAVRRIENGARAVRLWCDSPTGQVELTADAVICTIPFSVLREMTIDGPISDGKRRAISRLQYTSACRVYLQAKSNFWKKLGLPPNAMTDLTATMINYQTVNQPKLRRPVLECYSAGANARAWQALPEATLLRDGVKLMAKVFGVAAKEFTAVQSYRWDKDPWARGAYVWTLPGDLKVLTPDLATAEGRLHFAGDHTSALPGWIQGALESGIRVAEEVNAVSA